MPKSGTKPPPRPVTKYLGYFPNAFTRMTFDGGSAKTSTTGKAIPASDRGFFAVAPVVLGLLVLLAIAAFDVSLSYTPLPSSPPPPVNPVTPPIIPPPPLKPSYSGKADDDDDDDDEIKYGGSGSGDSGGSKGEGTLLATRVLGSIMIFLTSAAFIALVVKLRSQKNARVVPKAETDFSHDNYKKNTAANWFTAIDEESRTHMSDACGICEAPPAQSPAVLMSYDLGGGCIAAIPPVMIALGTVAFMSSNTAQLSGKGAAAISGYVLNAIGFFIALLIGISYYNGLKEPISSHKATP